jgi:hypothetical protein
MAKIIPLRVWRSRLPRRLLRDGWWLEPPPARSSVVAFPKRERLKLTSKVRHLTLVHSGN